MIEIPFDIIYFQYIEILLDFTHDNIVHYIVHYLEMIYEKNKS